MQLLEVFLIASGVGLLVVAFWLGKRRPPDTHLPRQNVPDSLPPNVTKMHSQLTELIHELHVVSHDVTVDLEQKLTELKELLQEADRKLEVLASQDGMQGESEQAGKVCEPPGMDTREARADPPQHERYRRIYQMADQGLSLDDIARRVEMGKGEIQLILSLRDKD